MNKTIHQKIIEKKLPKIVSFYKNNFDVRYSSSKAEKIMICCPFCPSDHEHPNGDTKYHLVINLDWGISKCFHCGTVKPNTYILKKYNVYNQYLDLLQEITNFSLYELQTMLKQDLVIQNSKIDSKNKDLAHDFVKKRGLLYATDIKFAKEYALSRTKGNITEISTYYADEKYIYIPIFKNKTIIAFIARLYLENISSPRFKYIKLDDESNPIAFIDEIEENISSDIVYITEGYFDAYAINASYGDYRSVAIFSKSNTFKAIENLYSAIPSDTTIVIALDSVQKDQYIIDNIDQIYNRLRKYFPNINICLLPEGDPSSIYTEKGPSELIYQLENNTITSGEYRKRRIIQIEPQQREKESIKTIKIPKFLLNLKNKE